MAARWPCMLICHWNTPGLSKVPEWHKLHSGMDICNHLCFNVSKCNSMLISRKGNPLQHPVLSLCGQVLEQVEIQCFKYLGMLLTSDLTWSKHTESICANSWVWYIAASLSIQILTLYCTCMKAWFNHIWSILPKCGTHTSKRISDCLRESKICAQDV